MVILYFGDACRKRHIVMDIKTDRHGGRTSKSLINPQYLELMEYKTDKNIKPVNHKALTNHYIQHMLVTNFINTDNKFLEFFNTEK